MAQPGIWPGNPSEIFDSVYNIPLASSLDMSMTKVRENK
jgi:hypothetical protein